MHKGQLMDDVKTWGDFRGKRDYLNHLNGKEITRKQAMDAMCYQCGAGYYDGRVDCETKDCPLYGYMPYRKEKPKKENKRVRSEKQVAASKRLAVLNSKSHPENGKQKF